MVLIFAPSPRGDHTHIRRPAILQFIFLRCPTYPICDKQEVLHHAEISHYTCEIHNIVYLLQVLIFDIFADWPKNVYAGIFLLRANLPLLHSCLPHPLRSLYAAYTCRFFSRNFPKGGKIDQKACSRSHKYISVVSFWMLAA
jgi:hypothetical protein